MNLADSYIESIDPNGNPPASRRRDDPPMSANDVDIRHMTGARFYNDGKRVLLSDGSLLIRSHRTWLRGIG